MANDRENNSMYLYQLVGAPIMSMIHAESQAMQASMDFIQKLGFEETDGNKDSNNFGKLREITFRYSKMDGAGERVDVQVSVPLLSLIPIPMLQIKEADMEMYIKVVDIELNTNPKSTKSPTDLNEEDGSKLGFLNSNQIQIKTALGRDPSANKSGSSTSEFHMKLKVKMEQAQFPDGIQKLLNLMSSSLIQEPIKKS